jgi:hypothetical protein
MSDGEVRTAVAIAESLMLSRLAQSEQMRDFFVQIWAQNPVLAKCAGKRIQDLLSPLARRPAGTDS